MRTLVTILNNNIIDEVMQYLLFDSQMSNECFKSSQGTIRSSSIDKTA